MKHGGMQSDSSKSMPGASGMWRVGVLSLLAAALAISLLVSCSEPTAPSDHWIWIVTDYAIPIDSLRVTTPVVLGDTLRVWLWAEIGPAPCYDFGEHGWVTAWHESDWSVHVTATGVHRSGGPCSGEIVYLEWEEYAYVPPSAGLVEIVAEPGLVETVEVIARTSCASGARSN